MEPAENQIAPRLKKLIAEELDVQLKADEIDDDAPFFENGLGIDSIAIVELITLVEDRFGIQFVDEELVPASFQNVRVLAKLIADKVNRNG